MKPANTKTLRHIVVQVDRSTTDSLQELAHPSQHFTTAEELLETWVSRLGHRSPNIRSLAIQLLSTGKVQAIFRRHGERFELTNYKDILTGAQALHLVEEQLRLLSPAPANDNEPERTQRILVQPPAQPSAI